MFHLKSAFEPCGDQPKAIEQLSEGVLSGKKAQVLLGITGSGKTFTMANIIKKVNRPVLIIAHNKTLAAQLYQEFQDFFPENAVEYFVSYYDYYQPEAYIARSDTYIEKDFAINDKIDRMRLSATRSLLTRKDVIIVASVSCIYGLGSPESYQEMHIDLHTRQKIPRDVLLRSLVEMQYKRNDMDFGRTTFRVRGDVVDIFPAYEEEVAIRIEFFGDDIERIALFDPLTQKRRQIIEKVSIYPASHYVTKKEIRDAAIETVSKELEEQMAFFQSQNKLVELQRIEQRTRYDLEMIKEIGFCKGIENYSRHFSKRAPGEPSPCLIDYFSSDWLLFVDESHQTIPQVRAMQRGDRARKEPLIDFGFRLPSAYDNRPLTFEEFLGHIGQVIYVSATPTAFELNEAKGVFVEQIIRPTGLLDPEIIVRPASTQVDDCLGEIDKEVKKQRRVLVTTLTKRLAEELTKYLLELGIKAAYLHSEVETLERIEIIHKLREGVFDVLVGINLLREGLDIPEVSLVAILDADKEGFLRSETSLIQTCGRAARNAEGRVIMYADKITDSIQRTINITKNRRAIQEEYNRKNNITPKTVFRTKRLLEVVEGDIVEVEKEEVFTKETVTKNIQKWEKAMQKASKEMDFETAIHARDMMRHWQELLLIL